MPFVVREEKTDCASSLFLSTPFFVFSFEKTKKRTAKVFLFAFLEQMSDSYILHDVMRKVKADGLFDSIRRDLIADLEQKVGRRATTNAEQFLFRFSRRTSS